MAKKKASLLLSNLPPVIEKRVLLIVLVVNDPEIFVLLPPSLKILSDGCQFITCCSVSAGKLLAASSELLLTKANELLLSLLLALERSVLEWLAWADERALLLTSLLIVLEEKWLENKLLDIEACSTLELATLDSDRLAALEVSALFILETVTILVALELKLLWLAGDATETALDATPASDEMAILEKTLELRLAFDTAALFSTLLLDNTEPTSDDSLESLSGLLPEPPPQAASNNILATRKVFCMNFVLEL